MTADIVKRRRDFLFRKLLDQSEQFLPLHDAYREPFPAPENRLPVLRWIQQIPVAGDPAEVDAVVRRNQDVLLRGPAPRLLLHGEPGSVVGPAEVNWCRRESAGLEIVSVGAGTHFLPEDQPEAISRAIAAWLAGVL